VRRLLMRSSIGYRDQLDRARRFQARVDATGARGDVDYQDDVWAFFQNCWHIKDWVKNDPVVADETKARIKHAVEASSVLAICNDIATGTKHRGVHKPRVGAEHGYTNMTIVPGGETTLDCMIEFPDGLLRSAREIARECMAEWERILIAEGLATGQRN
jgi:hypothetical protein